MAAFEKPVIEITAFSVTDVITTSEPEHEHDNGFVDVGDLLGSLIHG